LSLMVGPGTPDDRRNLDAYELTEGPPSAEDYVILRSESGLSPRRMDQAVEGLKGSWYAVHVVHQPDGSTVGMGRVIGDGGTYFHIIDMAVMPAYQRQGLGDLILTALLARIRERAPAGAYVNLVADPPGVGLYRRHGFEAIGPESFAMATYLS
jgi:ribosomal protein S18 acetylase RimI-like enzyme